MTTQYYSEYHRARVQVMAGRRTHKVLTSVFLNAVALVGIMGIAFAIVGGALLGGQL